MDVQFITSVAVVAADPRQSRRLFRDALGLPLEGEGDGYYSSGNIGGSKHFGVWPLTEAATVRAVDGALAPGQTSVGTSVRLEHTAASPVGMRVTVSAELTTVDGRRLTFRVEPVDASGTVAGLGTVERVVVGRDTFLARLPEAR